MCPIGSTGELVSVLMVFASSEKEIDPLWIKGADVMHCCNSSGAVDNSEILLDAHVAGTIHPGPPKCRFRGLPEAAG